LQLFPSLGGKSTPYFSRSIDSTNNLYCFMSTGYGRINVYGPITNFSAPFVLSDSISVEATETSIYGTDLTGDQRHELIIGQRTGGLFFMQRLENIAAGLGEKQMGNQGFHLFPNPTDGITNIRLRVEGKGNSSLSVYSLSGKPLIQRELSPMNSHVVDEIDLRAYPSGIYFVSVIHNGTVSWAKLIKD